MSPAEVLLRRVHARLALAGLEPLAQHAYLAVRARCPLCGPKDGPYRPLAVGCYGKDAPRWCCHAGCRDPELSEALGLALQGSLCA